jgi:two-component system, NarL family, nitrate/nitrite response regulator NarL
VAIFRAEPDFSVVANCRDGTACLKAIRELSPDLAVLDSSPPHQGGLKVLDALRTEQRATQVILLSEATDISSTPDFIAKRAYGVVSKEAPLETLVQSSRELTYGQKPSPHKLLNGHEHNLTGLAESPSVVLTERERQIMELVRAGRSNKEIGRQCGLSDGTVKVHLHHIYEKLAIRNRTALAVLAARNPSRFDAMGV